MSKYYNAEDVLAIFSDEERPLNWTDSEAEIQAENDFDFYKSQIESLPTIEVSEDFVKDTDVPNSEDCISREWVLEEFSKGREMLYKSEYFDELIWLVIHAPSVVPSRAEGEWIDENGNHVPFDNDGNPSRSCWCKKCGEWLIGSDEYSIKGNFCPNCGSKMKGE